ADLLGLLQMLKDPGCHNQIKRMICKRQMLCCPHCSVVDRCIFAQRLAIRVDAVGIRRSGENTLQKIRMPTANVQHSSIRLNTGIDELAIASKAILPPHRQALIGAAIELLPIGGTRLQRRDKLFHWQRLPPPWWADSLRDKAYRP